MPVKVIIVSVLCFLHSGLLHAEYSVDDLKKLFTDKRQRSQIDAVRSGTYIDSDLPETSQVKLSGYVTRSDGKSVVWINNKNTLESSTMGDMKVHQSSVGSNKKVTVTIDGERIRLKPGETWSEDSGVHDITK